MDATASERTPAAVDSDPVLSTMPGTGSMTPGQSEPVPTPQPNAIPVSNAQSGPSQGQENPGVNFPQENTETNAESFQSGQMAEGIQPSRWQEFGASLSKAFGTTWLPQLQQITDENNQAYRDKVLGVGLISPEEAQKRFPGMPEPWTTPVDPNVAQMQYDRFKAQQRQDAWIARGGDHPIEHFALSLGAGLVDPVNIAVGMASGGLGELAGVGEALEGAGFLKSAAVRSAENMLPFMGLGLAQHAYEEHEHTSESPLGSDLMWSGLQAVGMGFLHEAASRIFSARGLADREVQNLPQDIKEEMAKTAIVQHEAGAKVDTSLQSAEADMRLRGELGDRPSPYSFSPLQHPSERPMYAAMNSDEKFVSSGKASYGTELSDNALAMNHIAGEGGQIGEVKVDKNEKILNASDPLPSSVLDAISKEVEKAGVKITPEELSKYSAHDLLNMVSESTTPENPSGLPEGVSQALKDDGIYGIKDIARDSSGNPIHNVVRSFEPPTPSKSWMTNGDLTPGISPDQKSAFIKDTAIGENAPDRNASDQQLAENRELINKPPVDNHPEEMAEHIRNVHDEAMATLEKYADLDKGFADEIEGLKRETASDKQALQAAKDLASCVAESVS